METKSLSLSEWSSMLPDRGFEAFHTPEALTVIERHSAFDLQLVGGFKGDQAVALQPLFVRNGPLGTKMVSSPPPGHHVPHLGPILMHSSPKQSKFERVNREFTSALLDHVDSDGRTLWFVLCRPDYDDPRPYRWEGLSVDTSFTYHLDLEDRTTEDVLMSFSRSRRREIRDGDDLDVEISCEGTESARVIYRSTRERFEEQNEPFSISWEYVHDLLTALDDRSRVYVARDSRGTFLGGIITFISNDSISFSLGGTRTTRDGPSVNTLIHWRIIRDILIDPELESVTTYDLVGAGERRLSRYKAKFNPDHRPYYVIKSNGLKMWLAERAYDGLSWLHSTKARVATTGNGDSERALGRRIGNDNGRERDTQVTPMRNRRRTGERARIDWERQL